MSKWLTFIKERFQLPSQILLISGISLIGTQKGSPATFPLVFVGLFLFFFLLRAMDEYKDYEKDLTAHPERPLPRGLISRAEMKKTIQLFLFFMGGYSVVLSQVLGSLSGLAYLSVTFYLYLMYHEFYIREALTKRPLLYAISHQVILFPLTLFLFAARGEIDPFSSSMVFSFLVLLGGFFTYEVCRKLNLMAHPNLNTYPQIYGRGKTAAIAASTLTIFMVGGLYLGLGFILCPVGFLCLASLVYYLRKPSQYKAVENISILVLLSSIYSLGIQNLVTS